MKRLLLFVMAFSLMLSVQAQRHVRISAPRPKVGVVLGGGGAKGAAHIGVLKYLEELGIPVDYVAGTSMGSIMGGLYAIGYSPDELAELIANVNWNEYIGNEIDRDMLSNEMRKRRSTTVVNIPFDLEILSLRTGDARLVDNLPSAYVNNSSLINLFNDLCVGYQEDMDFNDLPIPFACVSTDLITGDEVVIRYGNMPTAMRASMAIPGIFAPVVQDDMVLVDGGLVNNFPADVLRSMGADIIIGVEVTNDKSFTTSDLKSMPQVMARLLSTSTSAKRVENRELCDIYIVPDVSDYNMLSFTHEAIDTLVNRGYQKAQEYHDPLMSLKRYVDKEAGYPVTKTLNAPRAKNLEKDTVLIRSVEVNGNSIMESKWMIRKSRLEPGQRYTKSDIERCVRLFRGTGAFDDITYTVKESDSIHTWGIEQLSDAYDLTFNVHPAKPHVMGLGVRYDTEEGTGLLMNLGLNEKKFGGSKLSLALKLSYSPRFNITYTYAQPSLANLNVGYEYRDEHFGVGSLEKGKMLNLHYKQHGLNLSISQFSIFKYNTYIGANITQTAFDKASQEQGSVIDSTVFATNRLFTPFFTMEFDRLDDAYFATRGFSSRVCARYVTDLDLVDHRFFDVSYAFQYYVSFGSNRFTVIPQCYGRFQSETECAYYNVRNVYGGEVAGRHFEEQLPFVGFSHVESFGPAASVLRCDLRYNVYGKHYITGIYNILVPWDQHASCVHGAGLKYSFSSLMGPVSLTGQWSSINNRFGLYFSFGYYF